MRALRAAGSEGGGVRGEDFAVEAAFVHNAEFHRGDDAFGAHEVVAEAGGFHREEEELHRPGSFRVDQRVEQDELGHAVGVAEHPVEADGAAEVVHAEVCVADAERVEECVERVGVEVVVVRGVEGLIGEAVARQVERDGAVGLAELGEDVAIEVAAGWEAVEEEDGRDAGIGGAGF